MAGILPTDFPGLPLFPPAQPPGASTPGVSNPVPTQTGFNPFDPFDPLNPLPGLPTDPIIPGLPPLFPGAPDPVDTTTTLPTLTTTPITTTTTTPSLTPTVPAFTPPPQPPPVVTITSTISRPTTTSTRSTSPTTTPSTRAAQSVPFFQNRPLVIGVFTTLGIVVAGLALLCILLALKRRRAAKRDREIAEAAYNSTYPFAPDVSSEPKAPVSVSHARGYSVSDAPLVQGQRQSLYAPSTYSSPYPSSASSAGAPAPARYPEPSQNPYATGTAYTRAAYPAYAPAPTASPYPGPAASPYPGPGPSASPYPAQRRVSAALPSAGLPNPYDQYYPPLPPSSDDASSIPSTSSAPAPPPNTRYAQQQPLVAGVRRYSQAQAQQQDAYRPYGNGTAYAQDTLPKPRVPMRQDSAGSLAPDPQYPARDLKVMN